MLRHRSVAATSTLLTTACAALAVVGAGIASLVGLASISTAPTAEAAATSTVSCVDTLQVVPPVVAPLESYEPVIPKRLVDTRDGTGGFAGKVSAGCTLRLSLADSVVPVDAGAAALSIVAESERRGFLTVFPCAAGRPLASNLNTRADAPTPNLVVGVPDVDRAICIFSNRDSDVVIDLQGWWSDGPTRFRPIEPVRAFDTRELQPAVKLAGGEVRPIALAPAFIPADATSVVVNLTATKTARSGWLLAYACGELTPFASNLNFSAGDTRAVAAIVGVGTRNGGEGSICIESSADAHVIVDVVGYYAPEPVFGPSIDLRPAQQRLVDTRDGTGPWDRPLRAGEIREIDPVAGLADAADATAVVINAVGLNAQAPGFLTFFPCSATPPLVSTLNTVPGREVSNLLTVELSGTGKLCMLSKSAGDVVLDLVGVMAVPKGSPFQEFDVSGIDVWPPFSPSGTDYAVECVDGINSVRFDVVAHRGRTVDINGGQNGTAASALVSMVADDVATVEMTGAGPGAAAGAQRYSFRCLPSDFAELSVAVSTPDQTPHGWYLTGLGGQAGAGTYAVILDERGVPIWYRRTPNFAINVQRLSDGTIAYDPAEQAGYGARGDETARVIALDGTVVANVNTDDPAGFPLDHHELLERPGGWTLVSYPLSTADVSVLGPDFCTTEHVVGGSIREVTTAGVLEWEWDMFDHFDIAESQYPVRFQNHPPPPDRGCTPEVPDPDPDPDPEPEPQPGEVDLFHINSLDLLDDGDYVVSARHLDAVFRIDRSTGDVEWILSSEPLGGTVPNKNGAPRLTIVGDPLFGPRRPHDARLDGNILTLFDNRTATNDAARAVAYEIDFDPATSSGTATLLWQIDEPFGRSSNGLGALRVQPTGNRVITWGGLQPMLNEFDVDGNLLLSVQQAPFGNAYRFVRYEPNAFDAAELRASASSAALPG